MALSVTAACSDDGGTEGSSSSDDATETGDTVSDDTTDDEVGTTADTTETDTETGTTTETETETGTTTETETETGTETEGMETVGTETGTETEGMETEGTETEGDAVCGDGAVEGDEACDDGVNDGAYGGCSEDCSALAAYCGDGELNGPEECDDVNEDSADGCLATCQVPASCMEILDFDEDAGDGQYLIGPKAPDQVWMAECDMTTDGGGWTGIATQNTCNGDLDSTLTAVEAAPDEGVDAECRPFTTDAGGSHTYTWDIDFPPGFDEFYLADYVTKARAIAPDTSEINAGVFVQTAWDDAHGGTARGDVSFGSADEPGPVVSYAGEGANFECVECEEPFPTGDTPFVLQATSTVFRVGWGEGGTQDEGWFPWWTGTVYVR